MASRSWRVHTNGYVIESRTRDYLHRVILGLGKGDGWHVDHLDGGPLNNTRSNLRRCTAVENGANRPQWRRRYGYRGTWRTRNGTWTAYAAIDGVRTRLGSFQTEREAALVAAEWRAEYMPFSPEAKRKAQGLPVLYMGPFAA